MMWLLALATLSCLAALVHPEDARNPCMSAMFASTTDEFSGSGAAVPSFSSHGVNIIFSNVSEQELLKDYLSIDDFIGKFFQFVTMVNPDVTCLLWQTDPPQNQQNNSYSIVLTVAVVEAMEALPSPEAMQLIQFTVGDPRILQLSMTPDNVSLAGIFPSISLFGNATSDVLLGETVVLTCVASGNPIPTVLWLKDGAQLMGNALDKNGILYIKEFSADNTGDYTCVATSMLGSAETHISLTAIKKCAIPLQYSCVDNTTCLPAVVKCDGHVDCMDGSDEEDCPPLEQLCRPDEMECGGVSGGCVFLGDVCNGLEDCHNGIDEEDCVDFMPSQSPCLANQFPCTDGCVALAVVCDRNDDCSNSEDERNCAPPSQVETEAATITVSVGATATLSCAALGGSPHPFITWLKDLLPLEPDNRFIVTSVNGQGNLTINNTTMQDTGRYTCVIVSSFGTELIQPDSRLVVTADDTIRCNDSGGAQFSVGEQYLIAMDTTARLGLLEAADIIFVVDESGSMIGEHKWLRQLVFELENSLRLAEVGSSPTHPNMYALVGFARDEDSARGGVIIQDLGTPQQLVSALEQLTLTGIFEDGYSGIDVALQGISTRPGTAKQLILVTDEHRGVLNFRLSRETIARQLQRDGFKLNVVVNQGFEAGDRHIMGIDSAGMGYLYNSSDSKLYTQVVGGRADISSGFKSTNEDYVELALQLGGGAWDLNLLRVDQNVTTAFTNAFVSVKIEEIVSTFRACFRCYCGSSNSQCIRTIIPLSQCRGPIVDVAVDPVVVVSPQTAQRPFGSNIMFQCLTHPVSVSDPIVQYRWYYTLVDNITPPPLSTNDSLELVSVNLDNSGHYVCEIETRNGVIRSANATLFVYTPPITALVTPRNPEVIAGDTVVFTCSIDLPIPVDQFIWTLNGVNLPANADVSSNNTHSSLTITNFEAANAGVYHCQAIVNIMSTSSSPSDILEVKILDNSNITVSVTEPASFTCSSRCVDTSVVCIGLVTEWTRRDEDELPTMTRVFTGHVNSTLHFPATNAEDAGAYVCTGRIFNFSESDVAFLTVSTVPVTVVIEANVSVTRGQPATLQCISTGSPQPECSFYKADDENMEVIATGSGAVDLTIASTEPSDAGSYVCECSSSRGSSRASATILVDCVVRQVETVAHLEMTQLCDADVPEGTPTGACIVFIVDESRSMVSEHRWLMEFSQILEDELNKAGIGLGDLPNRYGLVGFGARSYEHSRVIELTGDGEEISNVKTLEYGIKKLMLTGRNEDGYAGIETAHQLIMRHPQCLTSNIARQFILVTDEERDVVVAELNRSVIYSHINEFGGRLNIAVSEAFECKDGPGPYDYKEVLGLDSNGTGYSETTSGNVEPLSDCQPRPDSGYVTTNEDYTQLAFQLGGGAWNLNQLREGGDKAKAFTTAFLTVKVEEVIDQLKCVTCLCLSGELTCGQEVTKSKESST